MKTRTLLAWIMLTGLSIHTNCQRGSNGLSITLSVSEELQAQFKPDGRLFLFLCQNPEIEPRTRTWPNPRNKCHLFARNITGASATEGIRIEGSRGWSRTPDWTLESIPEGEYYVQVLWDQDRKESGINAPGNLYSEKQRIMLDRSAKLNMTIDRKIGPRIVEEHPLVRVVDLKSDTLSAWWGRPVHLKATVLLPHGYNENLQRSYPIRYNVAGYGGRYTRVNRLTGNRLFMEWWESEGAPRIINVFLDGEGPFGDSYQMDSDNSGPYGYALIHELIPHIEGKFRGTDKPDTRFVDGCSTGGWVSLGLQLYYPDSFNGAFSYSPDAIEFENYQLINIYRDENAFVNEYNYPRPVNRDIYGEPRVSLKDFITYENVLGASDTYLNSGGQFSAHTALYSPKGFNGLPRPLFDPVTGEIDHEVAEHWKKYDFKIHAQQNWEELGPKIEGKIYIWMGDMDNFYLNTATRAFDAYLKTTSNPASDAEIIFSPMEGHCARFDHKEVLLKMQDRINEIEQQDLP